VPAVAPTLPLEPHPRRGPGPSPRGLGDYLYDEGDNSNAFYVVLSGSLKDLGTAVIKSDGEVLGFDDYSLTRPRHAAVVALDRVVAVIFTQRTLDAIGRRDAHVLSTIVRAAASSGHDQL
jgi:CRP-like cAMP-binding protein